MPVVAISPSDATVAPAINIDSYSNCSAFATVQPLLVHAGIPSGGRRRHQGAAAQGPQARWGPLAAAAACLHACPKLACASGCPGSAAPTGSSTFALPRPARSPRQRLAALLRLGEKRILRGTMGGVRRRLAPIRGIPTKAGGMQDPNADLVGRFLQSPPSHEAALLPRTA